MSSETSTEPLRPAADSESIPAQAGMQPWQFFVLAGLGCATAITFLVRGQGVTVVLLVSVLMATAALVGMAALRTIRPLVSVADEQAVMIGRRTRAALEHEKTLALRSIKELEFDRAMGKVSEDDFREMSTRLRARAGRLIKQLDAGGGYRAQIERDLTKRMGATSEAPHRDHRTCTRCSTENDTDARFCKSCGERLR
jgi:hypothetical protein